MSSRTEQIMAYVEKMTDKERQALLSHLKKHEKAKSEPETSELPEKGANLVSSCMEKLLCFVWQRNRTVFVYEDAVLTYGSHKPFDPRKVAAFRRKLPAGEPWGFFVGGMDSPQAVKFRLRNLARAAGGVQSFRCAIQRRFSCQLCFGH